MEDIHELKLPRCPECGGKVQLRAAPGRTREFRRGTVLKIPDNFPIPTCSKCGEEIMIPEVSDELDQILGAAYQMCPSEVKREMGRMERVRHRTGYPAAKFLKKLKKS